MMAVVEFGGMLRISQNFTANPDVLHAAVSGAKTSFVASNTIDTNSGGAIGTPDLSSITGAEAAFGARSMLLSLRTLAKNLRTVPGRKMLVLFSAGFPLDSTTRSEMIATIDACNKANVAVYSLDVRGLVAQVPGGGSARNNVSNGRLRPVSQRTSAPARFLLTSYILGASPDPQHPVGGGGTGGGGGRPTGGGGGTGTGGTGTGGPGTGGKGSPGTGTGGKGSPGTGTTGKPGGTTGTTTPTNYNPYNNSFNNPYNQSRSIIPPTPTVGHHQPGGSRLARGRYRWLYDFQYQRPAGRPRTHWKRAERVLHSRLRARRFARRQLPHAESENESRRAERACAHRLLQRANRKSAGRQAGGKAARAARGRRANRLDSRRDGSTLLLHRRRTWRA